VHNGLKFRKCGFQLRCCEELKDDGNVEKETYRDLDMSCRYVWLCLFSTGADQNFVFALLCGNEIETRDPSVDKIVRLTDQERQTRGVWLVIRIERLKYKPQTGCAITPIPEDKNDLSTLVDTTCEARRAGFSLEKLKLELSLRESSQRLNSSTRDRSVCELFFNQRGHQISAWVKSCQKSLKPHMLAILRS
jgi:hypothetical protein